MRRGSFKPFAGWRTPNVPAPAVDMVARGADRRIVTVLYPSDRGCPIKSVAYDPDADGREILIRTEGEEIRVEI